MIRFSFVIPTYNNKKLLKNTLEALNHQAGYCFKDYEVIVVDDGSSDNTYDYIKGVNKNYELKYLYLDRTEDSCRSKTRNCGWKNSSGKIIIFIDSDIIVKNTYLSELDRCFLLNEDIVVIGNRIMLDRPVLIEDIIESGNLENYFFKGSNFNILEFRHLVYELHSYNPNVFYYNWMLVYSCNMALQKKYLDHAKGFDENFKQWGIEDLELGYLLVNNGVQIVVNNKLEVLHQYHRDRDDLVPAKERQEEYQKNIDYFLNKHPDAVIVNKGAVYNFFTSFLPFMKNFVNGGCEEIQLDFYDKNELQSIKEKILYYTVDNRAVLIINDYVEDTDLDIWIQLLGKRSCLVKYFPKLKRIEKEAIVNFFKEETARQKKNT